MTRACFMCGEKLVRGQWVMAFFWGHRRRFMVRVCMGCFSSHDAADIWWMLKSVHEEEGREIGQGP